MNLNIQIEDNNAEGSTENLDQPVQLDNDIMNQKHVMESFRNY